MKNNILNLCSIGMLLIPIIFSCTSVQPIETQQNMNYVPNEETAKKIAEAIWLPIYGSKIENNKPYTAKLRDNTVWVVEGTLKEGKGGVPYIEINKEDCRILLVTHGK